MLTTEQRIRDFVDFADGTDRLELASALRLPAPTVVSAVRRLIAAGELVETAAAGPRSSPGRRPRVLRPAGPATLVGLVSWDGSVLRVSALDVRGEVVATRGLPRPEPTGIDGLVDAVSAVVELAEGREDQVLRTVVVSVPAPYLTGHGAPREHALLDVDTALFPVTASGEVDARLSDQFGLPVLLENDANLAALGELYGGAMLGATHALHVTITRFGFGSAVIANGALVRGARGYAGELAHLQVDVDGPLCACGGRGCLIYRVRDRVVASAQPAYEEPITFQDLPRLAAAGDAGAARMVRDIGRALGGPLAHLCTFLDPEVLVVGGSLGGAATQVVAGLREVLAVQAPPVVADNMEVLVSTLGEAAEERGALELARLHTR